MNKIIFEGEEGEVKMPSFEYLESIISEYDGDAGVTLICKKENTYSNLIMLRCFDNYKFYILHLMKNQHGTRYYIATNKNGTEEICEIQPGGETTLIYDYCLVSIEETLAIIKQFLETGNISDSTHWKFYDDVDFPIDDRLVD